MIGYNGKWYEYLVGVSVEETGETWVEVED